MERAAGKEKEEGRQFGAYELSLSLFLCSGEFCCGYGGRLKKEAEPMSTYPL